MQLLDKILHLEKKYVWKTIWKWIKDNVPNIPKKTINFFSGTDTPKKSEALNLATSCVVVILMKYIR